MSKTWKIWIILFVAAGLLGLAATGTTSFVRKHAFASYQEKFPDGTEKHLEKYKDFFNLAHAPELTEQQLRLFQEKKQQLEAEQDDLLMADLHDLAVGKKDPSVVADFMYGPGWQDKVDREKTITAAVELVAIASTVSLLTGIIIAAGTGIKLAAAKAKTKHRTKKQAKAASDPADKKPALIKKAEPEKTPAQEATTDADPAENDHHGEKKKGKIGAVEASKKQSHKTEIHKIKAEKPQEQTKTPQQQPATEKASEQRSEPQPAQPAAGAFSSARLKQAGLTGVRFASSSGETSQGGLSQQVAKLQNMMSTEPVKASISELTEQMSAIREFASQQQDRFRQLQDGYDWNVIKRFCLRIIRCIDNLDMRIDYLEAEQQDTADLEEVRDELLFALESSGVEKFTPDTMSDYKGLERFAEAASQREMTEDEELVGKIARVLRPGYQYILNDNEVKVVRTAQVILFSQKLTAVSGVR